MTIQVTLSFGTPGEAAAAMLLLVGGVAQAASPAPKPAETAAPAATTPPATQEVKTPAPAASATKATAGKAKPQAEKPAPPPAEPASTSLASKSYPETGIGDLINGYLRKDAVKHRPTLVAALAALGGAKSGLEIKPEYYDAAHAAFKALNDGADPAAVLAGLSGEENMG
jgi:hypothetical protein